MSDVTPQKSRDKRVASGFSPIILQQSPTGSPDPGSNLTGPPRLARDLAANLHNNIQRWNGLHVDGADLVKRISSEKTSNGYTYCLEELTGRLYAVFQSMEDCVRLFRDLASQVAALAKISPEVLFLSHNGAGLRRFVDEVVEAYLEEYEVKRMVLENIAHSRNDQQAMFFAAAWTLQPNITSSVSMKLEALLVETGHRIIK